MLAIATTTLMRGTMSIAAEGSLVEGPTTSLPQSNNSDGVQARTERTQMSSSSRSKAQQYGYHNTFHLHDTPLVTPPNPPPTYGYATRKASNFPSHRTDVLPRYTCSVAIEGQMGIKCELSSPFMAAPIQCSHWNDIYADLCGTQLRIHKLKPASGSKLSSHAKPMRPGKLIKAYSLQHAEVGIAVDVKKNEPVPKTTFAKLMPHAARQKLFETDPHLFEPVREHNIRLRVETEQYLLCASTQEEMLNWVEGLTAAIDIAMPLEDRSEPRYRSLPRRARRQREIEGQIGTEAELSNIESQQRLIREQENLFRSLYPHLAADHDHQREREVAAARAVENMAGRPASRSGDDGDYDGEDLDRADALVPTVSMTESTVPPPQDTPVSQDQVDSYFDIAMPSPGLSPMPLESSEGAASTLSDASAAQREIQNDGTAADERRSSIHSDQDPEAKYPYGATPQLTPSAALRYRRRCAPVLLASSPRASDVIVSPITTTTVKVSSSAPQGQALRRVKIDFRKQRLVPFELSAPKYDAHEFSRLSKATEAERSAIPSPRPGLERGDTAATFMSAVSTLTMEATDSETGEATNSSTETFQTASTSTDSESSLEPSVSLQLSLDGASGEEITPAPTTTGMSREVSKASHVDGKTLSPSVSPDLLLDKTSTNDSVDLGQTAAKKSRRVSLHSRFLSKKTGEQRGKTVKNADMPPMNRPRPGVEVTSYAALMF